VHASPPLGKGDRPRGWLHRPPPSGRQTTPLAEAVEPRLRRRRSRSSGSPAVALGSRGSRGEDGDGEESKGGKSHARTCGRHWRLRPRCSCSLFRHHADGVTAPQLPQVKLQPDRHASAGRHARRPAGAGWWPRVQDRGNWWCAGSRRRRVDSRDGGQQARAARPRCAWRCLGNGRFDYRGWQ
jgi:hypothetical protein